MSNYFARYSPDGRSTPAVRLEHMTAKNRAANIPEFVNAHPDAIIRIDKQFLRE